MRAGSLRIEASDRDDDSLAQPITAALVVDEDAIAHTENLELDWTHTPAH
jgi:Fe-S cluster assembly iron-binding protein IscA